MKRYDVINALIQAYSLDSYLEIGLRTGMSFKNVTCNHKESVDPSWSPTYKMTSDMFFATNKNKYDIIFIDGLHEEEQVYRDIKNSLKCLNSGGFVVLHDCNPPTIEHTALNVNGTVYKGFLKAMHDIKGYSFFTVDTDHGCGVITKRKMFKSSNIPDNISWEVFDLNRNELLGLLTPENFTDTINKCK